MNEQPRHDVKITARIDLVRNARADEGEHRGGPLAAEVVMREQPIATTEN